MREKTKEFIQRISYTIDNGTDEELIALRNELNAYLRTLPKEEKDEFVQIGVGEALDMSLPPEAIKLPPEAYLD